MTSTSSASACALPTIIEPTPRRGFLRQLASLPLIGGGLSLLGSPTAAAEPVTPALLEAYKTWLRNERYFLAFEMASMPYFRNSYRPTELHYGTSGHSVREDFDEWALRTVYSRAILGSCQNVAGVLDYHRHDSDAPPSNRAALVLSAVGFDWRDGKLLERRA